SGSAFAGAAHRTAPAGRTGDPASATTPWHWPPASRDDGTSGGLLRIGDVPGQPDTGEDLPTDRVIPVAETRPQDRRFDRPRPAAQHAVVAVEKRLRVPLVDHRDESGPRPQR